MKKLILLLGILSMGFQCDDWRAEPISNQGVWRVKNATTGTVFIRPGLQSMQPASIAPGGSVVFYEQYYSIWIEPDFPAFIEKEVWEDRTDENISFEAFSADGTPISEWHYLEKDEPGKQFFNESSWVYDRQKGDRADELKVVWTFEIKSGGL